MAPLGTTNKIHLAKPDTIKASAKGGHHHRLPRIHSFTAFFSRPAQKQG